MMSPRMMQAASDIYLRFYAGQSGWTLMRLSVGALILRPAAGVFARIPPPREEPVTPAGPPPRSTSLAGARPGEPARPMCERQCRTSNPSTEGAAK
jgi:hypothetical protein